MKKIISLLLALMLICTFSMPAVAADNGPVEYNVIGDQIDILSGGYYIISSGYHRVNTLSVWENGTLIIGRDATVKVNDDGDNCGTLIVLGQLDLSSCRDFSNNSTLVAANGGIVRGSMSGEPVINDYHAFVNGVCVDCGYECPHENGWLDGKCRECGMKCLHTHAHTGAVCDCCGKEMESTATGSILSQGYPEIVVGIGGLAVGFLAAMLIFRKKKSKPATAEGVVNEEE